MAKQHRMNSLILASMPLLKLVRSEKPASYSIQPALTHNPMPLPRCQGRQPLQNLALLVLCRDLVLIPHIETIGHITNVFVCSNGRFLICCRAHLVLRLVILVVLVLSCAARRSKVGVTRERKRFWGEGFGEVGGGRVNASCGKPPMAGIPLAA